MYRQVAFCRLLGGTDDEKRSAAEDDAEVDVCELSEVESDTQQHIDDVINVMKTLNNEERNTTPTTTTTTSGLCVSAAADSDSSAVAVCSTLMDSDVSQALDAALQGDIDGLLSTISDDHITCTSSTVTASTDTGTAECLLAPAVLTEADQQYMFYVDTLLRSTDADRDEAETTELTELQAVELIGEDWPEESLNDPQTGGMLVEFDSSLLTVIELGSDDQEPASTEACLTVAPGGCARQVANGETTAWNVFQGLEVSQFQVVGAEQGTTSEPPTPEDGAVEDVAENAPEEDADRSRSDASNATSGPGDVSSAATKTDLEPASDGATDVSDDEYVLIVDCVEDTDADDVQYEIVDAVDRATDSDEVELKTTNDTSNDVTVSSA